MLQVQSRAPVISVTAIGGKCGPPPPVENGDILASPKPIYFPSETVTYQCQNFYTMEGSPEVTCQSGHWSEPPTCRGIIVLLWYSSFSRNKIFSEDGNTVEFVCRRGYKPHPNIRSLRVNCVEGKFDCPICIPVCIFSENYFNSPILTFLPFVYICIPIYLYLCIEKKIT
uniref:Sushi domain-containing protein n=1 Tax=Laticauda laticaudata TaxID=8630 RepID=A0A8C5WRF1_LATLA